MTELKNPFSVPKRLQGGNEATRVKKPVKKLLTAHGWFWWSPPANQYATSGISDIHAVKQGMFMVIETKFGDNDPTPLQMAFLTSVRAEQHFGLVVRETTVGDFAKFLKYLDMSIAVAAQDKVPGPEIGGPMLDAIGAMTSKEIVNPARFKREQERRRRKDDKRRTMGSEEILPADPSNSGDPGDGGNVYGDDEGE